jgi:hypothetical protein
MFEQRPQTVPTKSHGSLAGTLRGSTLRENKNVSESNQTQIPFSGTFGTMPTLPSSPSISFGDGDRNSRAKV